MSDGSFAPHAGLDPQAYRRVLGHFATGVVIVTALHDGEPVGMAVNSFSSVSLNPPLVMFCPAISSTTWPRIHAAGSFCVNVLGESHEHVARLFARQGADRFAQIGFEPRGSGSPVLDDAIAWIECDIDQEHVAGDHVIVVGRVSALHNREEESRPLLFYLGRFLSVG